MGKLEDFIDSLEGNSVITPIEVASALLELHNEEIGIRDAKIETLNGTIAEKDGALTNAANELTVQKAKNFDLAMQIPGHEAADIKGDEDRSNERTIADLFVPADS